MTVHLYFHGSNTRTKDKMFVAKRLNEILENKYSSEWLFVPSNEDPADNATRDLQAVAAFTSNVWPECLSDETH